ncbi:synaptotagmin like 2 S homeolog isoform X4 [Xenopus laevis]|uniref:Synaptotagmin-like protein 2 n=1 Tax=Xenopus laevis TaxID=8355 RepID=A0A8J0UH67_XENLA|nr:synaptotagmin like 2 S homeolog isoform X4 [Xenopus laevis]
MIDLSFLTEAEQEAILRVLNRDAELKKAEEERVQHLYDVVDDEQELKYKSGQWFYEAKSKRHRDKIHGTDLVRASMRKRKAPPPTLAELSRNYKENSSKKSWASSVNKDVFIPPELYGVLEDPEEEQGGFVPVKAEATQSSKRVSFLSTDKNMESLKNENVSPSRQRRNPFNSTNEVEDETEHQKDTQNQVPVNGTDGEDKDPYPDVLPSKVKFGVKLPYPAPGEIVRLSSSSRKASLTNGGDIPIPKPRTIPLKKTDSLDQSASDLKREDSFGSTGKPKSILKRRSSSSSTDSESIRMSQKADINKIVLPTPILQVGKKHVSAEPVDESPENSLDGSKQVRFSANVHQNPPSPGADALDGKEIDEFEILDPNVSQTQLVNPVHASSEDSLLVTNPSSGLVLDMLKKTMYRKGSVEIPGLNGASVEGPSLSTNSASLNEDLHNITENPFVQETKPEISLALEANVSSDNDPIYAMVKKPTELLSSGLSQDFDMEDAHKEPRFIGQGWKTQNSDRGGQKLVFGISSGGGGKLNFETNNLSDIRQLENVPSTEGTSNKENEGAFLDAEANSMPDMESEPTDDPTDIFPTWRRPSIITNEKLSQSITVDNLRKEQKDAQHAGLRKFSEPSQESVIQSDSAYSSEDLKGESIYTPFNFRNVQRVEDKPDGLMNNFYSKSKPYAVEGNTDKASVRFLDPNLGVTGLPIPSKFEAVYFRERLSDGPKEQMLNPEQKTFGNTEEKSNLKNDTTVPPSTFFKDAVYIKKPLHVDNPLRSSNEMTPGSLLPQNNCEIISEEELTSQKVASWLAQTPSIHGEEQIDLNEEQMYPGEVQTYSTEEHIYAKEEQVHLNQVVEESVERSMVNQKSSAEEFRSALQKLKEEMLQDPPITEMENTPDTGNVKATEPFHYAVDKNQMGKPTAYKSLPNSSFFQRVMQISHSINETPSASPDERQMIEKQRPPSPETNNQNNLLLKQEEVINDLSPQPIRAQTDYATPYDKHYTEVMNSTDSEAHEEQVVQEKVAAVKDAFKMSLEKLEEEYNAALANEAQLISSSEGGREGQVQESPSPIIEQSEEEVVPEKVPVVKDVFKVALERLAEEYESTKVTDSQIIPSSEEVDQCYPLKESPSPTIEQSVEEVVPEKVPVVKDAFKVALERLAEEYESTKAADAQIIPSSEEVDKCYPLKESPSPTIEQSVEEVVPEKVPVVKDAFKVALERLAEEYESTKVTDTQIIPSSKEVDQSYPLKEFPSPTIDQSKEYAYEVEESVEKVTVPAKFYQDEFTAALNKLQTEASEPAYTTERSESNKTNFINTENKPEEIKTNVYSPVSQSRLYETLDNIYSNVRFTSPDKGRVGLPHYTNFKVMTLKERISDGNKEQMSNPEQFQGLRTFWNTEDKSSKELNGNNKRDARLKTKDNLRTENEGSLSDASSAKTGSTLNDLSDENAFKDMSSKEPSAFGNGASAFEKDITEKNEDKKNNLLKLMSEKVTSLDINQHIEEEDIGAREWNWEEGQEADNTKYVSEMPSRDVVISKKVYPSIESLPSYKDTEEKNLEPLNNPLPEPQEQDSIIKRKPQDLYFAGRPEVLDKTSGSDQSGSITGSSGNLLYKKPESESPDVSKPNSVEPKQDPDNSSIPKEDKDHTYEEVRADEASLERSHFSDPEKLKRLSQSVPSFLNDDTDGRETDSASENSFQLGRHKKSPSSLTNLSGSSGMASLSSVSGSVMSIYSGDFGNVDIKGNIQFALDYADNLQEFQVFVSQCKDLAAADVKKQRSDPYVKAYLLPEKAKMGKRKTGVKKKNLNPVYNDVLRYKITKNALLSQTLNISVWHYDVLGRNSFLGEVEVNLGSWDWSNKQMNWYPLQPRTPAAGIGLENRGEMKLAIKYVPEAFKSAKNAGTGEVHIWLKECSNLPMLRGNKINSFIKCTILPDTSRKSRQKTRTVDKTPNPYFNHTMVYDGFKKEDLRDACVELTVWDHNKLTNHFLGGLRIGLGTGKSYGTAVDWMDSNAAEATTWDKMIGSPDTWVEAILPLRMLKMAKLAK